MSGQHASNQQIITELTRVKVLFQLRAIKAAMGLPNTPPSHSAIGDKL